MKDGNLELSLKRLDEIAKLMDDDRLPLEQALKLYDEASGHINYCRSELDAAKLKITEIFEK